MSTDFVTEKKVSIAVLHGTSLSNEGIRVHKVECETYLIMTDGQNYLHAYQAPNGQLGFTRFGENMPGYILGTISRLFDTEIFSEYCPQFWGYDTNEEWEASSEEMAAAGRHEFYVEIQKILRGEPVDVDPETIWMTKAQIAKELVGVDPSLLLAENEALLMAKIEGIYDERRVVRVTLSKDQAQRIESTTLADAWIFADAKRSDRL
jgi:hypothetical protein